MRHRVKSQPTVNGIIGWLETFQATMLAKAKFCPTMLDLVHQKVKKIEKHQKINFILIDLFSYLFIKVLDCIVTFS